MRICLYLALGLISGLVGLGSVPALGILVFWIGRRLERYFFGKDPREALSREAKALFPKNL